MMTLQETKRRMESDPKHWVVWLMDFVDDFRYHRNPAALSEPFEMNDTKLDALLASTAEQLCADMGLECPDWVLQVPACLSPWFVAGMQSLKAIALVESPLRFRIRKIFVLENFLSRV